MEMEDTACGFARGRELGHNLVEALLSRLESLPSALWIPSARRRSVVMSAPYARVPVVMRDYVADTGSPRPSRPAVTRTDTLAAFLREHPRTSPVKPYADALCRVHQRDGRLVRVALDDVAEYAGDELVLAMERNTVRYLNVMAHAIDNVLREGTVRPALTLP